MMPMDTPPEAAWSSPEIVSRFATSPPNDVLMTFAKQLHRDCTERRVLDIGCGAGCNAVPLARMGWNVLGIDLSAPMLAAAEQRARDEKLTGRLRFVSAPMDHLPVEDQSYDLIVAHGIWNLARSAAEFRKALGEAARAARPGSALFVYTFSRNTFPPESEPVEGEPFVFTEFSGRPQCFLSEAQLIEELGDVGFDPEPGSSIREYPRPLTGIKPAIYEGLFRRGRDVH